MKLYTYLNYDGNCQEAFRFYEQHLAGKITMMMTHAQGPNANNVPPDWKNAVLQCPHRHRGDGRPRDLPSAAALRRNISSPQVVLHETKYGEAERQPGMAEAQQYPRFGRFQPEDDAGAVPLIMHRDIGCPPAAEPPRGRTSP